MATTLAEIRYTVEQDIQDILTNEMVVNQCNVAQTEFMLRVKIPKTATLDVDTTTISYTTLPTDILEFRRFRYQSDIENGYNRSIDLIYNYYNGKFEVPAPFPTNDKLLIDYYANIKIFTKITDEIDLEDQFKTLYTTYVSMVYFNLPSTWERMGETVARKRYEMAFAYYQMIKKQVMDYYIVAIGTQKPAESGW